MTEATRPTQLAVGGIELRSSSARELRAGQQRCMDYLRELVLDCYVVMTHKTASDSDRTVRFRLSEAFGRDWAPNFDTLQLCKRLGLDTDAKDDDLEREIVLSMLLGPVVFVYPSFDEFLSAVRIRRNIVKNARKTALAFDTEEAERPEDYWTYAEATGFTLLPGRPLIPALEKATQPDRSGQMYSFSCYRATEYVVLLGIAQELASCNPELFAKLERCWGTRALMAIEFQDAFLHEYGSEAEPLPLRYYVPGDRLWFRNPHEPSSNIEGYEGSWVFYLGNGLFTNFWKRDQPFTLVSKCVELFHWRHGTYVDSNGKLQMDEDVVEERVRQSLQDPAQVDQILSIMYRLRDPFGVYVEGGCIDATREHARWVCHSTADIRLPE